MPLNEHWTQHFRYYDKFQFALPQYREMLDFHAKALRGTDRVLDSGAGTGNLTRRLLEEGHRVVAVDYNKSALNVLRRKGRGFRSRLETVEVDLTGELPFPDNHFNGIASSIVIPFVPNVAEYLREHYRVLKPGGVFSLSVPLWRPRMDEYIASLMELGARREKLLPKHNKEFSEILKTTRTNVAMLREHGLTERQLVCLLKQAGFRVRVPARQPYSKYVLFVQCRK